MAKRGFFRVASVTRLFTMGTVTDNRWASAPIRPPLSRDTLLPEADLPDGHDLVEAGRRLARHWRVGDCAFLEHHGFTSELQYKLAAIKDRKITFHAQLGFRDPVKTRYAWAKVWEVTSAAGHGVDRFGVCLDWSMGFPRSLRADRPRGTGLILESAESFASLTRQAPVAPHFGDFVLGFPAAVENTQFALSGGATVIGNLGQYFTFRLPGRCDDVVCTTQTLVALGLIAAQPVDVLVHSNLDDGFAALFSDLTSALGAVLLEQYIVEHLVGARCTFCFGHHYSDPTERIAFQRALHRVQNYPGSMVYGNTVSYRGDPISNYAALATYLRADIQAQRLLPSGHAINPVPVSENLRIPDIEEITDAQRFAIDLAARSETEPPPELAVVEPLCETLVEGAKRFRDRVLTGLGEAGINLGDAFEVMLVLRRLGARELEQRFGCGAPDQGTPGSRRAIVPAGLLEETQVQADKLFARCDPALLRKVTAKRLCLCIAASDVHEHGKWLLQCVARQMGIRIIDAGVAVGPAELVAAAVDGRADAIAISTYNGIALSYCTEVLGLLVGEERSIPVLIGGRLNEIPEDSNSSLPVDVSGRLEALGVLVCSDMDQLLPVLAHMDGV